MSTVQCWTQESKPEPHKQHTHQKKKLKHIYTQQKPTLKQILNIKQLKLQRTYQ